MKTRFLSMWSARRLLLAAGVAGCIVTAPATTAFAGSYGQQIVIMDDLTSTGVVTSANPIMYWCLSGMNQNNALATNCNIPGGNPPAYLIPVSGWWWVGATSIQSFTANGSAVITSTPVPGVQTNDWWCASDLNGKGWSSATTGCPPPANVPCPNPAAPICRGGIGPGPASSSVSTSQDSQQMLQALTAYAGCMQAAGIAVNLPTASNLAVMTAPEGATAAAKAAAQTCNTVMTDAWKLATGG